MEAITSFLQNKRARNTVIAILLFFCLAGIITRAILNAPVPPPPGALRAVICKKCQKLQVSRIVDPQNPKVKCSYCGGDVGMAWKCGHCGYVYYVVPRKIDTEGLSTMRRLVKVEAMRGCPNCGETRDVRPMSVDEVPGFKRPTETR